MRIFVKFSHSRKSSMHALVPGTFRFSKDCGTGPVIEKGKSWCAEYDLKEGDVVEFATTKFDDEPELLIWRKKVLLNSPEGKGKR